MATLIEHPTKLQFNAPADILEREAGLRAAAVPVALPIAPAPLAGTWINCDKTTRGLIKLIIAVTGNTITVHGFGACTPTPCDWKVIAGLPYADNVTASPAVAFSALYQFGFKQTLITGRLDAGLLLVETFDHFTDGSGRSDYFSRFYMEK